MPKQLPEPAKKGRSANVCVKPVPQALAEQDGKIPGRLYVVPETGEVVSWCDDRNPAMWRGQQDED